MASPPPSPSQRRLQRLPDATGARLTRFSEVFVRHGLPVLLVGLLCLFSPGLLELLWTNLGLVPERHLRGALLVLAVCLVATWRLEGRLPPEHVGWILYLLCLSTWEEWVFRLVLPHALEGLYGEELIAVLLANLLFGALHWFTLRWRLRWCVMAFLGGMAFSAQLERQGLATVVLTHWLATFLNTPRPPGRTRRSEADAERGP
jgi:hypothetical protein